MNSSHSAYQDRNMRLALGVHDQGVSCLEVSGVVSGTDFQLQTDPLKHVLGPRVYETKILLNLEKATMLDSSGVGWLLSSQRGFRESGGMMVLYSIPPLVQSVLKLLRMDRVFNLAEDLTAARMLASKEQP